MKKKILLLAEDDYFLRNIKNIKENVNIYKMNNVIDALKFYDLFKEKIDIVIIDEKIQDSDLMFDKVKSDKPVLYIKKPIKQDQVLKRLIELEETTERNNLINQYITKFTENEVQSQYKYIKKTLYNFLLKEPDLKTLTLATNDFYLQSFQTQTHIKNLLQYTNFFSKEILKSIKKLYIDYKDIEHKLHKFDKKSKEYKECAETMLKKLNIFYNHIELFFGDDIYNSIIELSDLNTTEEYLTKLEDIIDKERKNISMEAFFHDIGKNFVDINILDSTESLNEQQFDYMNNHTPYGKYFIEMFKIENKTDPNYKKLNKKLNNIQRGIEDHHKRGNIKNYISKLIRFVDQFEALSSHRSYKQAYRFEEIEKIMFGASFKTNKDVFNAVLSDIFDNNYDSIKRIYLKNIISNIDYYKKSLISHKTKKLNEKDYQQILEKRIIDSVPGIAFRNEIEKNDIIEKVIKENEWTINDITPKEKETRKKELILKDKEIIQSSLNNILINLSSFDNPFQKEASKFKNYVQEKKSISSKGDSTIITTKILNLTNFIESSPKLVNLFGKEIFEQYNKNNIDLTKNDIIKGI